MFIMPYGKIQKKNIIIIFNVFWIIIRFLILKISFKAGHYIASFAAVVLDKGFIFGTIIDKGLLSRVRWVTWTSRRALSRKNCASAWGHLVSLCTKYALSALLSTPFLLILMFRVERNLRSTESKVKTRFTIFVFFSKFLISRIEKKVP